MNAGSGMKALTLAGLLCLATLVSVRATAAEPMGPAPDSRQRGAEIFVNLCMLCHSMKYVDYQDLLQLGFSRQQVDALRRGRSLKSALHSDMTPDAAGKLFGMAVPDLSLMAIAREGGDRYISRLLTGYYQKSDGSVDNHVFPQIRMPDVLGVATESDAKSKSALEAQARDVAGFLGWAAQPKAEERKRLGIYVLVYLIVLTVLLYLVKQKVWRRLQ